ncbi:bifunctional metallophosphatase/5'-nucleotidase [Brachybacterium vulturis]|uniref:Bifunctional metallophosphatase/5'-nucleotidase n=1 Tax=Brachybacterium vulturis TaxID=2017484 RepID=A0A291GL66_9MICO|nr:S-layer homology domain-containing protein [Brachybacterium vulturis]ATG50928.1 bifunctional metallophosphatase/5'-nucleotidase [Brachybacterium vulturis]
MDITPNVLQSRPQEIAMLESPARRIARGATVGLSAAAIAFASAIVPLDAAAAVEPGDQVSVLAFNDLHGQISIDFACSVVRARALNPNHALLSVGDNVGASTTASAMTNDEFIIDYLNALGVDASAIGDHEYDQGRDDLTGRIEPRTSFPDLAANVFVTATGKRLHQPYAIVDAGEVKVAVVGAVTTKTVDRVAPALIDGLEFRDPVDSVNQAIAELDASGEEYDVLVASYHEGAGSKFSLSDGREYDPGVPPAITSPIFERIVNETSTEVDAILTGDTHQAYAFNAPVPGEDGEVRPVVQARDHASYLGLVSLELGADGDWDPVDGNPKLIDTQSEDLPDCAGDPTYETARKIVLDGVVATESLGIEPVGSIAGDITPSWRDTMASYVGGVRTANDPVEGQVNSNFTVDNPQRHSAMGGMIADSMKWYLEDGGLDGAHEVIGFVNRDNSRGAFWYEQSTHDEGDGVVMYGEAVSMNSQFYTWPLMKGEVTGAQFEQILEEQWQRAADGGPVVPPFLAFGVSENVEYVFDSTRERDDRIVEIRIDGEPIDSDATYTIITMGYLFNDGGNLPPQWNRVNNNMWTLAEATDVRDAGVLYRDVIINYLEDHPNLAPDFSQRQLEVQVLDGAAPTLRVLGMESQSLGAPLITEVAVDAGEFGTFTAPVVRDEETGRLVAEVDLGADFCVPEGERAILEFTATPDTGTAITHEITGVGGEDCGSDDTPTEPAEPSGPEDFSDVPPSTMFYEEIMWMRGEGYTTGWEGDNTFRPLQPVNRDAMAAFLYRMAGSPEVDLPSSEPFTDVQKGDEHYAAIMWAYQQGITTGWEDGTFRPTTPIARDAMAAFVFRYAGSPDVEEPSSAVFSDVPASNMFAAEVAWMKAQRITTGWPDGTFRPLEPTNRDATAAFLYRMNVELGITYTPR